ncbi:hypothetical protein K1719_033649 [Acacia pycnantha]|nr:hypothetical protein K1719_033649 [Acacia pycnantha]
MASNDSPSRSLRLSNKTPFLGLKLYFVIDIFLLNNYELAKVKIGDEDPKKEKVEVEVEVERRGKTTSNESDVSGGSRSDVLVDARNIRWG